MQTRWGILGSGGIAKRRTIPEGLMQSESADLVAVYDKDPEINREVAQRFGAIACASEEELLSSPCDVVYVATPVSEHCRQVINAAKAGKHVFCEKPLGRTVQEAEEMAAICSRHNVKFGVGFMMRFHAQHQEALKLIEEGKLGTPVYARAQATCWYPPIPGAWRQDPATGGGGSLIDMGCHCIDLLEMFFGKVASVYCTIGNRIHAYPSEDSAIVALEFQCGAKGIVEAFFNVPDESTKNRLELYGSNGSILAEHTIGQGELGEMTAYFREIPADYNAQQDRDSREGIRIAPKPVNMYYAEVEAFSRAVLFDADPPVNAQAGVWSQKIIAACYESARSGRSVPVA
ncbi:MAG TPA: Gfo/Idh/MocA family oxidoreductase [Candidatus Hydrogenedentes bacterium]|nr:Gfo/Idh/MocA family oxidoreductase [Candidatus Hydrogenedentota bacterium]HOL76778.1 Gfo/Idh/MocA family oxidoreductase [Candidatus Hydrogenedentota bacterium]HPO85745.1 Gfo/Idh/MocA family oxidoreductase [Candidatus Hydrogenedentota bacterium]